MEKDDLKCLLIGRDIEIYKDLASLVRRLDKTSKFVQVDATADAVKSILKKINEPCLIFIFDEVPYSLEQLSDLVWQNSSNSLVVIVSTKSRTVSTSRPFDNTQFSRINLKEISPESEISLQFLIQAYRDNVNLRRCKDLLGTAEKRCQWLVDSSREAVAFISRDMHLYANTAYLTLFKINSLAELKSTTVKDLILSNEQDLFEGFAKENSQLASTKNALTLSMKKQDGSVFRSQIYLIPSVFKGQKCSQLWIKVINEVEQEPQRLDIVNRVELDKDNSIKDIIENNDHIEKTQEISTNEISEIETELLKLNGDSEERTKEDKTLTLRSKLDEVSNSHETTIMVDKLSYLKVSSSENKTKPFVNHQLLSLKVTEQKKKEVDQFLLSHEGIHSKEQISVFWDRIKFLKLQSILVKRKKLQSMMMVRINQASLADELFMEWLQTSVLSTLSETNSHLVMLLPSNLKDLQRGVVEDLIQNLKGFGCHIGFDQFVSEKESMALLKTIRPSYVRLSRNWVYQIKDNKTYEERLIKMIQQFEHHKIQVIAPCSYDNNIRVFFEKSGASFCQEIPAEVV